MSLATRSQRARIGGAALPLDPDGFVLQPRLWTRDIAQQLAHNAGLGTLGNRHWMVIDYVRDRYLRTGALPPMRSLCRRLGVERDTVKAAFGDCRQLWQIAGLPNPGEEALTYMN